MVSRIIDPLGVWLSRRGVTANAVTLFGTAGAIGATLWFFPRGQLLAGTLIVTFFVVFDLLDGALARASGSTSFGAVLDASCDRIVDGVLFSATVWWSLVVAGELGTAIAVLVCLVSGQVISYIKAKAEAAGLAADGAIAERAERLLLLLFGTGLQGLGVPSAVAVFTWLLAVLSLITVMQRLIAARQSFARQNE